MWEKEIWIAKRISIETDEYGNDIERFDKPKRYFFNYQPISGNVRLVEYGEERNDVYRTFVDKAYYLGKIKTGDRVYLEDGETLACDLAKLVRNDDEFCKNANYVVKSALPQNLKLKLDFIKR